MLAQPGPPRRAGPGRGCRPGRKTAGEGSRRAGAARVRSRTQRHSRDGQLWHRLRTRWDRRRSTTMLCRAEHQGIGAPFRADHAMGTHRCRDARPEPHDCSKSWLLCSCMAKWPRSLWRTLASGHADSGLRGGQRDAGLRRTVVEDWPALKTASSSGAQSVVTSQLSGPSK